jgi:hypothetical protein
MKPTRFPVSLFLCAAAILFGAGCATPQDDGTFDVTWVNITAPRVGGGGIGDAALNFTVRLQIGSPEA